MPHRWTLVLRAGKSKKLATVLFADLVGSTQLADAQDPERTRALLTRFYDAMAAEITGAGGTVEKFVGDAVMAAFGAPAAHEDHAERALHAALAMQRRLKELFGDTLALRIGVNTGEVIVGMPREGSSFVTGDTVNVAARLEQAAAPGEILVGERTAAVVRGAFELAEPTIVEAKGKAGGLASRRLLAARSLQRSRGIAGLPHGFVGRDAELDALATAYQRTAESSSPHLVTVIGDAGVGKTTLMREFWTWLEQQSPEPRRRTGRCLPYGQGGMYMALGDVVREHLGLRESDSPATVRERLGAREILGLSLGLEAPENLHPLAVRDRLQQAWVEFLEELAAERPVVLVVEDLHWAEEGLLDLLDGLFQDVRRALLVVATGRPELQHDRPVWGGRSAKAASVWLEPLSADDSERLLEALIPSQLPRALRRLVVERAEGNPLFVEEIVATLIDQRVLQRRNGGWTVGELPAKLRVPDTVQAVLAARIDLLQPAEKAALQAAAVVGSVFWSSPVYELLEGLEPDLRVLEDRDFIGRRSGTSLVGEREFAIKHTLTREVAYGSLPKPRRARLHAAFAAWLERTGEGRDEHAALLAHHYAEATRPEDADLAWSGEGDELARLQANAVTWLRRSAVLAIGRYEMEEALSALHRALDLAASDDVRVALWREIGRANALVFDGEAFSMALQQAIALSHAEEATADLYAELAFQALIRAGMWRVIPDSSLLDGWIARALKLTGPESAARAKALVARCYLDSVKSPDLARGAQAIADRLGDPVLRSYSLDVLGLTAFATGDYEAALGWQRQRVGLADEILDPDHRADIYAAAIAPAMACGGVDEARRYTTAHDQITEALSPHHRLHGVSALLELEELLGNWPAVAAIQPRAEDAVAANVATPCVRNPRSLLVSAHSRARTRATTTRRSGWKSTPMPIA